MIRWLPNPQLSHGDSSSNKPKPQTSHRQPTSNISFQPPLKTELVSIQFANTHARGHAQPRTHNTITKICHCNTCNQVCTKTHLKTCTPGILEPPPQALSWQPPFVSISPTSQLSLACNLIQLRCRFNDKLLSSSAIAFSAHATTSRRN